MPRLATVRSPATRVCLAALAVALLAPLTLWPGTARGYVRTCNSKGDPAYWNRPILPLTAYVGDLPPPLTGEQVLRMTRFAAAAWSRPNIGCTQLEIRVSADPRPGQAIKGDGRSQLVFVRSGWPYGEQTLALTSTRLRPSDGRIVDSDIEVNAQRYTWVDVTVDPDAIADPEQHNKPQDFQGMLVHEMGHMIGFAHSCDFGEKNPGKDGNGQPPASCGLADAVALRSVMVPSIELAGGFLVPRTLSDDDTRGICDVYRTLDPQVEGSGLGGCASAPTPSPRPAGPMVPLVAAVGLLLARSRRRPPS